MISTRVLIDSPPGEKILPKWCLNPRGDDLSPREEYLLQNLPEVSLNPMIFTEVPIDSSGGLFFPQISFTQSEVLLGVSWNPTGLREKGL